MKLNIIVVPIQIFNADETALSVVHNPGKVVAQLGCHYVYSITSAEGARHTQFYPESKSYCTSYSYTDQTDSLLSCDDTNLTKTSDV